MRRVTPFASLLSLALAFPLVACGGGEKPAEEEKEKKRTRSLTELKQADEKKGPSKEEQEAMREKLGLNDAAKAAAENAKMFEKGAREYVKTRLKEYKAFVADVKKDVDEIEASAKGWAEAADNKAFDKFAEKYKERSKELSDTYDALTARGAEGGETQVDLGQAYRGWEELKGALAPKIGADEKFAAAIKGIRDNLAKVDAALADIEKDESLKVDESYKPKKK